MYLSVRCVAILLMIRAVNVSKRFGDVIAVDDITLEVPSGTILGMIGPNGAGKTTLVRMMVGIIRPTSGACYIGDKRADLLTPQERESIGYMTQQRALYPDLTARQNLEFFAEIFGIRDAHSKQKAIANVAEFTHITEYLDRPVEVLSGGTAQRLSLACTMIHSPSLIFLDEPTVGVNPNLRAEFWDYFQKLARDGKTIVMTTHYLEEASRCDNVAMILQGRLIAYGPPNGIISSLPLTRTIIGEVRPDDMVTLKRALDAFSLDEMSSNRFKVVVSDDASLLTVIRVISQSGARVKNIVIDHPGLEEAFAYLAGVNSQ